MRFAPPSQPVVSVRAFRIEASVFLSGFSPRVGSAPPLSSPSPAAATAPVATTLPTKATPVPASTPSHRRPLCTPRLPPWPWPAGCTSQIWALLPRAQGAPRRSIRLRLLRSRRPGSTSWWSRLTSLLRHPRREAGAEQEGAAGTGAAGAGASGEGTPRPSTSRAPTGLRGVCYNFLEPGHVSGKCETTTW